LGWHSRGARGLAFRSRPAHDRSIEAFNFVTEQFAVPVDPIDKHVGARLRMRRLMLEMSQTDVGNALGLTFQQIQKYEKGANRISASRLQLLCDVLKVSVSFFFDETLRVQETLNLTVLATDHEGAAMDGFLATSDGLRLVTAFMRIGDPRIRRAIVALVEQIATGPDSLVH
jgi:transcriptional regulator with XRE-family HTH domain